MAEIQKIIGLMSGTSLDGIDAALLETDGDAIVRPRAALTQPYDAAMRALLRRALEDASAAPEGDAPPSIRDAEVQLTDAHAEAVRRLLDAERMAASDIACLGFHGQTILHRPEIRRTWQIGDGARLARATGIAVVNDFRGADVAAGGQGAPFVPLYHAALVEALAFPGATAVLNVGGVANITYVAPDGGLLAFDTGPGNAPLDDWAFAHTGEPVDRDGRLARSGNVDLPTLNAMLDHPYFSRRPPKSLDRLDFGMGAVGHLSSGDGAATLTAFVAASVTRALEYVPEPPARWIVCGGGRHNPALMEALKIFLGVRVLTAEEVGWRGDFIEAEAFAYLAARSMKGLPLSLPSTTGVPRPMTGGRLHAAV